MAAPLHKRVKRALRSALIRLALRVLGMLPLGPALWLGGAAGRVAYRLAKRTRALALEHLALAFPEKTPAERERIARDMFVHLGRSTLELASIRWFDSHLEDYVEVSPPHLLRDVMARGRGTSEAGSSWPGGSPGRACLMP